MKISIIGSGRIGSNAGRWWAADHQVMLSSRHPEQLQTLANDIGNNVVVGSVAEAGQFGDILFFAFPWRAWEDVLDQLEDDLSGKIIIDATNQFGQGGVQQMPDNISATEYNTRRVRGAALVKAYNTLTAGFQAESAGKEGDKRVVMPIAGGDIEAKKQVATLISESGFDPFDVGGFDRATYIEPPRRVGAFYGEAWNLQSAQQLLNEIQQPS